MSAMLQSLIKKPKLVEEQAAHPGGASGGPRKMSVKDRQSQITKQLQDAAPVSSPTRGGVGGKKIKTLDDAVKDASNVKKAAGKFLGGLTSKKTKKKKAVGLDFQLLPPPDESMELGEEDMQAHHNAMDEMSASASGRLQSPRARMGSTGSTGSAGTARGRRLSLAVQSRQQELHQRFTTPKEHDDSFSNHSDEMPLAEALAIAKSKRRVSSAIKTMEDSFSNREEEEPIELKVVKKRVSAVVQHNPFVEGDEGSSSGGGNMHEDPTPKLSVARKRMSTAVLANAFVTGVASKAKKRFSGKIKRENSLSRISISKVVTEKVSIQEKLQMERKKAEERKRNSIARIVRPKKARRAGIFSNGVKMNIPEPLDDEEDEEEKPPTLPLIAEPATKTTQDFSSGRKSEKFEDVYKMGKKLGEGAFGEVFVCIHKETKQERAVKVLNKDRMDEWEYDEVLAEFQMLTQMDNPNVIRVYEFYDNEDTFYMVQELAQGGELFDELEKHGKLEEKDVALLMKNILGCIKYLADKRIVHRDVNLENILLEEPGNYNTVKLIDFGLATTCEEGQKLFDLVGKARYLAPEVLGDDGYDLGYDVWSCGIIAAILLTGYFPFDSDSDMDVYTQIVEGAYINYDGMDWDGISDQAKAFVKSLLMVDEVLRPTAEEALTHPWITDATDATAAPTGEVWVAPQNEKKKVEPPPPPPPPSKVTVPMVVAEPTPSPQDFVSGRKEEFGDVYELGRRLGEGAFGEVYVCTHKQLKVDRAVKIIDKNQMSEWEYDDVIKEFQMLTQIDNPNVIRVYEFYDTEDTFYIVQELAKGGELFDELEKHGKLEERDVALLMKNILACTDYLAQNRIVHRDINLENILLEESGNYEKVKLIDFGLATKCEDGQKLFELVGKARYLAPEVLGDDGYDLGYDVWSCGIIAAILLTGYFPFDSDSDMDVYNEIVAGAYINYDGSDWEGISNQAKSFVKKLLEFEVKDRCTAAEALKHPWITGNTDDKPATGEVWTASTLEAIKPKEPAKLPKQQEEEPDITMPSLVEEATGSAKDFVAGRDERFEDIYEMGRRLGEGAFGEVFVCKHRQLGVERAVKVIDKNSMSEWEYDDVIKEFQMLTKFDNPNVIRVYEFYDTEDTFYIVQELAQGGELFDELDKHGKLKEKDVALLMKHILGCTKYLADHRIVHRDINLENVLLEESGNYHTVKLIDFGLAAQCEEGQKLYDLVGKARYLAPEVLGDNGYGLGYDVWSCGIIAAILLTGYFPFDADLDHDVYTQILEGAYIDYNWTEWQGISAKAKSFVKKLLTFEEDARPTAAEALKHPFITGNTDNSPAGGEVWCAATPTTEPEEPAVVRRPGGATQARPREPTPSTKPKPATKAVNKDEAARRIQKFMRFATPFMKVYNKESAFWALNLKDVERNRQQDLDDIKRMVEFEKRQIALELELKYNGETYDKSIRQVASANLQMAAVKKGELRIVKQKYQTERKELPRLRWENRRLASGQPLQSGSFHKVQENIKTLQASRNKWMAAVVCLRQAKSELRQRVAEAKRKAKEHKSMSGSVSSSDSSSSSSSSGSSSSSSSGSSASSVGTDITDITEEKKHATRRKGSKKSKMSKSSKSTKSDDSYSWKDHRKSMDSSAPAQLSSTKKKNPQKTRISLAMDGSLRAFLDTSSEHNKPVRRNSIGSTDMDKEMKGAPKRKGTKKKKDNSAVPELVEIGTKDEPPFSWQNHSKKQQFPKNGRRNSLR